MVKLKRKVQALHILLLQKIIHLFKKRVHNQGPLELVNQLKELI